MLEYGYIKLHRKIVNWEWYGDVNTSRVFVHLLLTANYEPQKWQGVVIERGQRVASWETLSKETRLSIQNVKTAIKHLNLTSEVTSLGGRRNTVFTVVNYELYQSDQQGNQQATNNLLTSNQQATNNNVRKLKKEEEIKEVKNIAIAHFETFWSAYPRKTNRAATEKIFAKLKVDDTLIAKMLTAVEVQKQSSQWQDIKYIPYPTTWLNQKRWEDIDGEPFGSPPSGGNESISQGKYGTYL